jgi:hypothetical protein
MSKFTHENELPLTGDAARAEMRRKSRRGFLTGGIAAAAAYGAWHWIRYSTPVDGLQKPLRAALNFNSEVSRHVLGDKGLAPTFPASDAVPNVRLNGNIGIDPVLKLDTWKLQVTGFPDAKTHTQYVEDVYSYKSQEDKELMDQDPTADAYGNTGGSLDGEDEPPEPEAGLLLTLDDIRSLPHIEMVTQLKCIEGWSEIVHWGGARFSEVCRAANTEPRVLRRSLQSRRISSTNHALLRDERPAALPRTWSAAAPGDSNQVRHQAPEAGGKDQLYR